MLTGSYRKRLDADLIRWVAEGLVSAESAAAIRRSLAGEGGFRLPALLGLFGGLLIAAGVAAFVAANWEEIPRLLKLGMIVLAVALALGVSARLERNGSSGGAEAAATCGVLLFGAGIALVGQMYHLPADWPGGALLVALGALAVAFLLRSNGALAVAFAALCAWSIGRWTEADGARHLPFLALYLPALWIACSRTSRFVHHLAVLALLIWLGMLPGNFLFRYWDYGLLAYGLAISVASVGVAALALDRGGPAIATCFLPWGLMGLALSLSVELVRILERGLAQPGRAYLFVFAAYAVAIPVSLALALLARERRFAWPAACALLLALLVPAVFWSGIVTGIVGKIAVAGLILFSAIALVAAGSLGGVRRMMLAGSGLFGLAILILLWQTIGTLLDQSLFFLVAGVLLLAMATLFRRLFARLAPPKEVAP